MPLSRWARRGFIGVALAVLLAGETVARPWEITGRSMEPQLVEGSLLLVDAVSPRVTGYQRGDIVIIRTPPDVGTRFPYLIKRVVALGGEHVEISGGTLRVDGVQLAEPYLAPGTRTPLAAGTKSIDLTVPDDAVFVLGDRRGNSLDSKSFGPVSDDRLRGRVWLIVGPGGPHVPMTGPVAAADR